MHFLSKLFVLGNYGGFSHKEVDLYETVVRAYLTIEIITQKLKLFIL